LPKNKKCPCISKEHKGHHFRVWISKSIFTKY